MVSDAIEKVNNRSLVGKEIYKLESLVREAHENFKNSY